MLNYSELRKTYISIRKQQGIGVVVDANRAPRMRFKPLKWTRGGVYLIMLVGGLAFWALLLLFFAGCSMA